MKSFILLLALSTPLFARMGETKEQCIERYGPVVIKYGKYLEFRKSEYTITVEFFESKVSRITYKWADPNDKSQFSEEAIDAFLLANDSKGKWQESSTARNVKSWRSVDGKMRATLFVDVPSMLFSTEKQDARDAAEREAEEKKSVEGF